MTVWACFHFSTAVEYPRVERILTTEKMSQKEKAIIASQERKDVTMKTLGLSQLLVECQGLVVVEVSKLLRYEALYLRVFRMAITSTADFNWHFI